MKQTQGITEQLKAENALEWVGRLGNIRACAKGDCKQGNHFCISEQKRQGEIQCHLDKDNIAVRILFTASKHFVYSLFFYI